jgi:hypothetical protein
MIFGRVALVQTWVVKWRMSGGSRAVREKSLQISQQLLIAYH